MSARFEFEMYKLFESFLPNFMLTPPADPSPDAPPELLSPQPASAGGAEAPFALLVAAAFVLRRG